ncbi:histone-lysine N-methyltransferase SETDB1-B-like isoform X2 [Anneissia japonica]|uniref:histone-lysine N-methyltransferase SETDB1-B-like isoform X2 n=1 Tax=Anneissia japonica TaxID=1529436 RepID=UPI001425A0DD|nr:histone-lysine N-methyltransferase SETDB1-B-like isoform X2 [Anneissia japonica]
MAKFLTGPALQAVIDECAERLLEDPELKSAMEELDKGISKLLADIKEAERDELRIIEESRAMSNNTQACQSVASTNDRLSSPQNDPDDVIFIGKVAGNTVKTPRRQARPELVKDMKVLAKRKKDDLWYDATILELLSHQLSQKVKVKFDGKGSRGILSRKHIALKNEPRWDQLPVGSRIIAKYENDADVSMKQCLYAGIIAETPLPYNRQQFLVFFDDGFAQYMDSDKIFNVYEASRFVWEDVHEDSREFIKEYLEKYPERPMVRVSEGQVLKTEWKGSWWKTRVLKVQGSLVNMLFLVDDRTEWIYRGSPRLEPLHRELMAAEASRQAGKVIRGTSHTFLKRNAPVVEYINVETPTLVNPEERSKQTARKSSKNRKLYRQKYQQGEGDQQRKEVEPSKPVLHSGKQGQKRDLGSANSIHAGDATVECIIDSDPEIVDHKNKPVSNLQPKEDKSAASRSQPTLDDSSSDNNVSSKISKKLPNYAYKTHVCCYLCVVQVVGQVVDLKDENPLRWPQIVGWQRELSGKRGSGKKTVFYRTPCMKRLRNLDEVNTYLMQTCIDYLFIDNFTFDPFVYTIPRSAGRSSLWCKEAKVVIKDISNGKEMVPVMLVNEIDNERPDKSYNYITYRKCNKAVINTDTNFLVCCDCTDNCKDKSKCACQQLTIESTRASHDGKVDPNAGYHYRRLEEQLPTGIFECNSKCGCAKSCYNRVAQNGLRVRLQVFKTEKRGWGLRCIDDIPAGMFICTYAGNLWTEEEADDVGRKFGDEYFAELDYIEVVEKNKEGYESDVQSSEGYETESSESSCNSDADFQVYDSAGSSPYRTPSADEISLDEGYAATHTKSGTKIVLRRKSASNGTQSTKESWSVVESPGKILQRATSLPCSTDQPEDSAKQNPKNLAKSSIESDCIIIISSDEEDVVPPAANEKVVVGDVKTTTCDDKNDTKDVVKIENVSKEDVKVAKEIDKVKDKGHVSEEDKPGTTTSNKDLKMETDLSSDADHSVDMNTSRLSNLDSDDQQNLENALTAMFTGHTDDEGEALVIPKEKLDKIRFIRESSPELNTIGGINYGYNVSPRPVLDNKAIIAYRERRRKKRLKLGETEDDKATSGNNEGTNEDASKGPLTLKPNDSFKPPTSEENISSQPITESLKSNQPVTDSLEVRQTITEDQQTNEESISTDQPVKVETPDEAMDVPAPESSIEIKDVMSMAVDSEASSSDSEDEKESMESCDASKTRKIRTAKKSTHTRLALTKSPSIASQEMANISLKKEEIKADEEKPTFPRSRSLFGEEERCYVMDAKREGNLGRYFNHSCVPNLFVQNVFVDTHDLRFPWLAFFAGQNIRAGSELTWDYGYEVGSVANKTLYCYCSSVDCRGRLL